jgi:hypothetical protein
MVTRQVIACIQPYRLSSVHLTSSFSVKGGVRDMMLAIPSSHRLLLVSRSLVPSLGRPLSAVP